MRKSGDDDRPDNTPPPKDMAIIWSALLLIVVVAALAAQLKVRKAADVSPEGYPMTHQTFLLDTVCDITIYEGGGEEALDHASELLRYYDSLFNKSAEESDIALINSRSSGTVEISEETADMLFIAAAFSEESGGALEPAIRPVSELWDFKEKKTVPEAAAVAAALEKVKNASWQIIGTTFAADNQGTGIDVGAFAKGYIADRLREAMVSDGVSSAIINLGGNVLCIGRRPDGDPFRIAVMEPDKDVSEYSHIVEVDDESMVTSGIYERYFEQDGVLYHHILDPSTGYPVANDLISVTVKGPESFVCDAMSTAVFVMGEQDGQAFVDEYNRNHGTGYTLIFLRKDES